MRLTPSKQVGEVRFSAPELGIIPFAVFAALLIFGRLLLEGIDDTTLLLQAVILLQEACVVTGSRRGVERAVVTI